MNMPLALLNRRRRGAVAFSPTALFALAEPGVWYDPSDLTTLFQDTAGTTPVTTPGQSVALALDKSRGLVLGGELVTNGDFSNGLTGWSVSGTVSVVDGAASVAGNGTVSGRITSTLSSLVVGRTYRTTFTQLGITGGGIGKAYISTSVSIGGAILTRDTVNGSNSFVFVATATTHYLLLDTSSTSASIVMTLDNVSIRELPGNHATQATAGSRPIYGIVPVGGRRNLLTRTEEFDNAAWTKGSSTVVANNAVAPDATTTADLLYPASSGNNRWVYQTYSGTSNIYTRSVYAKASGKDFLCIDVDGGGTNGAYFNLSTGAVGTVSAGYTASIQSVGSGWYRCSVRNTSNQTLSFGGVYAVVDADNSRAVTASGTNGVLIWGAQLETGSTATAYQRVVSQYDVTEAGVSSLSYLQFDTSKFLVTSTITPGVDKAQVFAGVRKLSDAATGVLAETGTGGTFRIFSLTAPNGNGLANYGPGLTQQTSGAIYAVGRASPFAAPITNVVTSIFDWAASGNAGKIVCRVNATAQTLDFTNSGGTLTAGNFDAQPLYIGARGPIASPSLPFNGLLYSLIVRFGANLTADQITSTETWVNGKTRAY